MLSSYLPLSGSDIKSAVNNMTGSIMFKNVDGIKINSVNKDLKIWEVYGNTGQYVSEFGFDMFYKGSAGGNENSLSLNAHNQSGTHIEVYEILQNGATT